MCLFSECPVSAPYGITGSTLELYTCFSSLQADGNVAFEYIPTFGVCRPAYHDSSSYSFVLTLFHEAVPLSKLYVASNVFNQHNLYTDWGVVYNHHICFCIHIFILSSGISCCICCNYCGVTVIGIYMYASSIPWYYNYFNIA